MDPMRRRLSIVVVDRIADAVEFLPRVILLVLRAPLCLIDQGPRQPRADPRVLAALEALFGGVPHHERWTPIPPSVLAIQLASVGGAALFCAGCAVAAAIDGQGTLSVAFGAMATVWFLVIVPLRGQGYAVLRAYRLRLGRCERCGYDLRMTTARCPECGSIGGHDAGAAGRRQG